MKMRYGVWAAERFTKGLIRLLILYPLMLLTLIPYTIYTGLCVANSRLDRWRW